MIGNPAFCAAPRARVFHELAWEAQAALPPMYISEIINGVIRNGFALARFDRRPSWTDAEAPGEFTLIAHRG